MSKPLILFGTGKIAEVIYYYAKEECGFDVVAFTVDDAHQQGDTFQGLPVVPFSRVAEQFPPASHDMFVAVGYHDLNRLRETQVPGSRGAGLRAGVRCQSCGQCA